jgi:hypothetical protein
MDSNTRSKGYCLFISLKMCIYLNKHLLPEMILKQAANDRTGIENSI